MTTMLEWVQKAVRNMVESHNEEAPPTDPYSFRASESGYCMRQLCYRFYVGGEKQFDDVACLKLFRGIVMHAAIQQALLAVKAPVHLVEKELCAEFHLSASSKPITISGHTDWVLRSGKDHVVVDWKEVGEWTARNAEEKNELPDAYRDQGMLYIALLRYNQIRCNEALFLYSSDDGIAEYPLQWNEKKLRGIIERLGTVAEARARQQLAPREYSMDRPPCTWCPYAIDCWGTPGKEKVTGDCVLRGDDAVALRTAREHDLKARRLEEQAASYKSQARALVVDLIRRHRRKRLSVDGGPTVTWVKFIRESVSVVNRELGLRTGVLRESESTSEYPLWSKGGSRG